MNPVDYIYSCTFRGVKLGLNNTRHFLLAMGEAHLRYPVIHIAGTSGKGSVCAFLSRILREAGLRVGNVENVGALRTLIKDAGRDVFRAFGLQGSEFLFLK